MIAGSCICFVPMRGGWIGVSHYESILSVTSPTLTVGNQEIPKRSSQAERSVKGSMICCRLGQKKDRWRTRCPNAWRLKLQHSTPVISNSSLDVRGPDPSAVCNKITSKASSTVRMGGSGTHLERSLELGESLIGWRNRHCPNKKDREVEDGISRRDE